MLRIGLKAVLCCLTLAARGQAATVIESLGPRAIAAAVGGRTACLKG
jgi:hypothetical protein